MGNIWLTSDFHFCHNKEFLYAPRNFNGVWEMNSAHCMPWLLDDIIVCLKEKYKEDNK